MLDGLMLDYDVDDGEVNEDVRWRPHPNLKQYPCVQTHQRVQLWWLVSRQVWERHFDHEHGRFMWLCPVTGVTLYTVPIQGAWLGCYLSPCCLLGHQRACLTRVWRAGQEDPDYDAMLPFRRYHKDDIYAKMAIEEADAYVPQRGAR